MNDEQFNLKATEMMSLIWQFRQTPSSGEKRILRDTIRAIAKELTRV